MRTRRGFSKILVAAVVVVLVALMAGYFVFVWSPFRPSSTSSTTSTISTPANLMAAIEPTSQTACAGRPYSNSSLTINWGNLAPTTEGIQYLCLENTGTTPVTITVGSTLSPSVGRVTSPNSGTVLNGRGIIEVELDLWLTSSVQAGPVSTFTITVGAKS
ncbi:MAG: hypothetical protein OK438_04775 [Thaumarchaeota archaeon]|nr:hypothetical protein [Nitrososphaerota archaeon]